MKSARSVAKKVSAAEINEAHRLAKECAETAVQHAIRCGQLLIEKKAELEHGDFEAWVKSQCSMGTSTARRYMLAARQNATAVAFSSLRGIFPSGKKPAAKSLPQRDEIPFNDPAPAQQIATPAAIAPVPPAPTPVAPADELDPDWEPEINDDERLAEIEKQLADSLDKAMAADDKFAAAVAEIKRQAAEIAVLKQARDGFMRGKAAATKLLQAEQRKTDRLEKKLKAAEAELEALRERIAIMEAA